MINSYNTLADFLKAIGESGDPFAEFAIHRLELVTPPPPYQSPLFRANYFTFVLIKSGRTHYTLDDQQYTTGAEMMYFTNPGHLKAFQVDIPSQGLLMSFSEAFLKKNIHPEIFKEFPFLLAEIVPVQQLESALFQNLWQLGEMILEEKQQKNDLTDRIISSYFRAFLLKVKAHLWKNYDPIVEGDRSSEIVRQFKVNLEKHFRSLSGGEIDKVYQVANFADLQHLHPNYLSTVIKSKTGRSVHDWINDKMIAEAKAQLQHGDKSVKEIAFALGFSEANYFSKYFKKQVGMTPGKWRKQE